MGIIKLDVKNIYLAKHPKQERMLKPFLNGFSLSKKSPKGGFFGKME